MNHSIHKPLVILIVLTVALIAFCGCGVSQKKLAAINDQIGSLAIVNDADICSPRFHCSALLPLNLPGAIAGTVRGGAEGGKFAAKSGSGEGAAIGGNQISYQ